MLANTYSRSIFDKHKTWQNFNFLTKITDYTLCKNASFAFFLNPCLYCLERLSFYREHHQTLFPGVFCIKRNVNKISNFDQNHGLTPLEKCQFCGFFKPMFSLFRKAGFLYKTSKIVYWRFIFTIYDMGIQGVTRGYRGIEKIIESFS